MIILKDFSAYRSILMGVAIVFIMASHTLGGYAAYGIIGVEWFLILSGIGQYFSLRNNGSDISGFYQRKLSRIIPDYLIISIPYFCIQTPSSIGTFLIRLSGMNLFLWGEKTFWFVTLIFICYLIAPFYFKIVNTWKYSLVLPFLLTGVTFFLSFHLPKSEILVTRIPSFILGMNLAKFVFDGTVIPDGKMTRLCYFVSALAVLALLTIYLDSIGIETVRLVYFFCGVPTLFFVLYVARHLSFLGGILSFLGSLSYELYLVHQNIALAICERFTVSRAGIVLLSYGLAILFAFVLHVTVKGIHSVRSSVFSNK